ncbi:MAG TPA: hypothetical protein VK152_09010 [Paludibacter sp.]|nr:hypothetical protein [Paludibacter sp.]
MKKQIKTHSLDWLPATKGVGITQAVVVSGTAFPTNMTTPLISILIYFL